MGEAVQEIAAAPARPFARISALTITLWFLTALLEGIDLQSAGIAGPGIAKAFALNAAQMGRVFGFGTAGLCLSAALGGWLADRYGRKRVLVWAVVVFGIFSLVTAQAWSYGTLLSARVLTGLGLGAAIPNLIALVFESTQPGQRNTVVGMMYCGMPLGSALAAAIGWAGLDHFGWQLIFYCGGLAPIIVAPLLAYCLRESPAFAPAARAQRALAAAPTESVFGVLARHGRAAVTLTLWLSSFCTYFALYLLLNWLPTLLVHRGFSGSAASAILVLFNLGGVTGIVAGGILMDRWKHQAVVLFIYTGVIAVLLALSVLMSSVVNTMALLICAFAADFFAASSQMVQYGLAPLCYDTAGRGTGVGAMVGVGRTGAIAGPIAAGQLLAMGAGSAIVLSAGVPGLLLSALALLTMLTRSRAIVVR